MSSKRNYLRFWLTTLSACFLCLNLASTSHARSDDWVRVQRFNQQLEKARAGDARAMYEVGYSYENARGVDGDTDKAIEWYEKAAKNGSSHAGARLGVLYFEGRGVKADPAKAYAYLSKAAKDNVPLAQYYLGRMFESGHGVTRNYQTALKWYSAAAKNGYYDTHGRIAAVKKALEKEKFGEFPKPSKRAKPVAAKSLLDTIMEGDWQRGDRPADFLPSAKTHCKAKGQHEIRCQSDQLTRNSGGNIITYVTLSSLSGFNGQQQFRVGYRHNIIRIQKEGQKPQEEDGEEFSAVSASAASNIHLGVQKLEHKLACVLEKVADKDERKLVCIKDKTISMEFSNASAQN